MPIRFYNPILKKSGDIPTMGELVALLQRAAGSLQEYSSEVNGDMNDTLAMEIESVLARIPKTARKKMGYGVDVGGEVQSGSGSQGTQKNVQDNSTGNATDGHGSPKNPANHMHDDAAEEFPELNRPSKVRFL